VWGCVIRLAAGTFPAVDSARATHHLTLNELQHLGCTHDGTTLRVYRNGIEIGNVAAAGTITWSNSRWVWGGNGNPGWTAARFTQGVYRDLRVENVIRDADWFRSTYRAGPGHRMAA